MGNNEDATRGREKLEEALKGVEEQAVVALRELSQLRSAERYLTRELQQRLSMLGQSQEQALAYAQDLHKTYLKAREETLIRTAYERFLPDHLVETIMANPQQVKLGGERRLATVLMCDIRQFTARTRGLEPEEVVHLLNHHFAAMAAIIFKYEGTLDKFMGDGLMAIFGAPISHSDDVYRAAQAALEMQETRERLNEEDASEHPAFRIGIGINTGYLVAGNIGTPRRMDYTVIGSVVNEVARLTAKAKPGEILISEGVHEEIEDKIMTRPTTLLRVKGMRGPMRAYSLLGLKMA